MLARMITLPSSVTTHCSPRMAYWCCVSVTVRLWVQSYAYPLIGPDVGEGRSVGIRSTRGWNLTLVGIDAPVRLGIRRESTEQIRGYAIEAGDSYRRKFFRSCVEPLRAYRASTKSTLAAKEVSANAAAQTQGEPLSSYSLRSKKVALITAEKIISMLISRLYTASAFTCSFRTPHAEVNPEARIETRSSRVDTALCALVKGGCEGSTMSNSAGRTVW